MYYISFKASQLEMKENETYPDFNEGISYACGHIPELVIKTTAGCAKMSMVIPRLLSVEAIRQYPNT